RGNPNNCGCWLRDDRDCLPRLVAPQTDCLITAFRGQQTPIRGERDDINRRGVPFARAEQLAASRLPELHRLVSTPAGQRPTLRIKRHTLEELLMPFERAEQLAGSRLPELNSIAGARQHRARGAEG